MSDQVCLEEEVVGANASGAGKLSAAEAIREEGKAGRNTVCRSLCSSFQ